MTVLNYCAQIKRLLLFSAATLPLAACAVAGPPPSGIAYTPAPASYYAPIYGYGYGYQYGAPAYAYGAYGPDVYGYPSYGYAPAYFGLGLGFGRFHHRRFARDFDHRDFDHRGFRGSGFGHGVAPGGGHGFGHGFAHEGGHGGFGHDGGAGHGGGHGHG